MVEEGHTEDLVVSWKTPTNKNEKIVLMGILIE